MMAFVKTLSRALLQWSMSSLDWAERRAERRRSAVLRDHYTLEICLAGCVLLLLLSWFTGTLHAVGRSVCTLALIVVFLKLWQLLLIANRRAREDCNE